MTLKVSPDLSDDDSMTPVSLRSPQLSLHTAEPSWKSQRLSCSCESVSLRNVSLAGECWGRLAHAGLCTERSRGPLFACSRVGRHQTSKQYFTGTFFFICYPVSKANKTIFHTVEVSLH